MALRTEDKAVEEGLGPLPGQDRTGGAGTKREQDRAISDVVEVGASNLAWSQAADMRERLACHLPARRPGCPVARRPRLRPFRPRPGIWAGSARGCALTCVSHSPPTAGSRPSADTGAPRAGALTSPCVPPPAARPRMRALGRQRRGDRGPAPPEPSLCHGRDGDPGGDRRSRLLATPSTGTARKRRARPAPADPGRMAGGASAPCRKLGIEPTDLPLLGGKDSVPT